MKRKFLLPFLLFSLFLGASCKKDSVNPDTDKESLLKDSTYYYSLAVSLWEDKIPQPKASADGKLDLRSFTKSYSNAETVLEAIKKYTVVDRYSFIDREGVVSEEIQEGVHKETGLTPIFISTVDPNKNRVTNLYVKIVQKNSPAEKAGLKRGMQIISVNGDTKFNYDTDQKKAIAIYYKLIEGKEPMNLVVKPVGESQTKTIALNGAAYSIDPILINKVFTINNKKIGYFFYTSFVNVYGKSGPNEYYEAMVNAFKEFETANIDELIVDLRYNSGGSTASAELLANLIVPTAGAKGKMYDYKVNKYFEQEGYTDNNNPKAPFKSVFYNKKNTLNIPRVYFLGTPGTASASELVMNVLKPYMDVEIITINGKGTYGKPVGFFGLPVVNGFADLYITSFQTINKDGYGDYFNGLTGRITNASDGFFSELGNTDEAFLNTAINDIMKPNDWAKASSRKTKDGLNRLEEMDIPEKKDYRNNMYKFLDQNFNTLPPLD